MSVGFGTPVSSGTGSVSLTGVSPGQPILLVVMFTGPTITVSDTFATPYIWSLVDQVSIFSSAEGATAYMTSFIGTQGYGAAGIVTVPGGQYLTAVALTGASILRGLGAVYQHGSSSGNTLTFNSVIFTPLATGEGIMEAALAVEIAEFVSITSGSGTPWSDTIFTLAGGWGLSAMALYPNPPVASTHASWTQTNTFSWSDTNYLTLGMVVYPFVPTNPAAPTLQTPATNTYADVSAGETFSAVYNSTDYESQNAYSMRMKLSGGTYGYWDGTDFSSNFPVRNTITTLPGASFSITIPNGVVVPGGTFVNGGIYDWAFASQEAGGNLDGAFAADFVLNAQSAPIVTVTAPTGTIITPYPTVSWTETLGGGVQTAYQIIVEFGNFGTVPGGGATAWNSGVVSSPALSTNVATSLQPNAYRAFVQITQTGPQLSAWSYSDFDLSGAIADVPGVYDVAIGGHGYMIDTTFEFGRRDSFRHSSIPAQRDATDITNQPGEATINPQGLWRSEFNDWSMGSGQLFVDRHESQPNRYHHGQGVDVFTNKWYVGMLPDVTQLIADTAASCQIMVVNGFLIKLNAAGVGYSSDGVTYTALTGLSGTPVMMCNDGNSLYIACGTGGVYTCVTGTWTTSQLVNVSSQNVYFVAFTSNVLLVASGTSLYQVSGSITSWPTALIDQPETTWVWNCACAGNGWIYVGGFAGATGSASVSTIFKTQFQSDGTTLVAPTVATPLPPGEQVYSMFAFVNYILVGTSLGVRFCQTLGVIDPSGQDTGLLKIGPIIPNLQEKTTEPVRCFTANQRFVYFGWSDYSASTVDATSTCTGLGWLDIGTFTGDQTPAYTSHLMVPGAGEVTSMDWWNGAPVFTVKGQGVYTAAATYVPTGNVYSGYIGFRIPDQKILIAYSVDTTSTAGSVGADINQDDENEYSLGIVSGASTLFAIPQIYGELFETNLALYSTSSNTVPTTVRRATLQAYPAITAGKFIITALRFWDALATRAGRREFFTYQELAYLEGLRATQTVVTYQEGTNTWSVVVDDVDFVEYMPSELPTGGFQGICMVTLKTASSGLIT